MAPSFAAFTGVATASLADVLRRAQELAGAPIDVAALDMPLATVPIRARREADRLVSRAFGAAGCAVHSPTPTVPGPLSDSYREALAGHGLPLATASTPVGTTPAAIEVYPHPALLRLLSCERRFPYKVARARRYWPSSPGCGR